MNFANLPIKDFTNQLASSSSVPGGGGTSALVGALGSALASMVASLTVGKEKYAEYEEDLQQILSEAKDLQNMLLKQIDEDARCFEPLSKIYRMPKNSPDRNLHMENALQLACTAPFSIMKTACRAIELCEELIEKGSNLAISDVGAGVMCLKTALMGASLNIYINANQMKDKAYSENLVSDMEALLNEYSARADRVYDEVVLKLK